MKRPYVRPEVMVRDADIGRVMESAAKVHQSVVAWQREDYEREREVTLNYRVIPPGEEVTFPTFEEWQAARRAGPTSCAECGCDGRLGTFHDSDNGAEVMR